jgi:hypothetical protein
MISAEAKGLELTPSERGEAVRANRAAARIRLLELNEFAPTGSIWAGLQGTLAETNP